MIDHAIILDVIARLRRLYPGGGALEVGEPYHVLVMVILSAIMNSLRCSWQWWDFRLRRFPKAYPRC